MSEGSIRLPVGVRDFLPRAAARRRAIIERLLGAFESWGYARIITPAFEYADVLERGLGADARAAAIRFVEPATGEVVALRPDITPQVARIVATRLRDVSGPVRLCYEGAVSRLAAGARGQREVLQAGVELIGVKSPDGDAEVLAVAAAALASMQVDDVRLDVGHVALARAGLAPVTDPERRRDLESALAKKDRAAVERAARGLAAGQRALLAALPGLYGSPRSVLARARKLRLPAPARRALATIEQVLALAKDVMDGDQHRRITIDLGEVRGFEYYTGLRFAGYAAGAGDAVLRGGRYDELLGAYGHDACATGFAVDVEAIAQTERIAGIAAPSELAAVLIAPSASQRSLAARVAAALRARGMRVAVDPPGRRSTAALVAYADQVGYARVLIVDDTGGRAAAVDGGGDTPVSLAALGRAARGDVDGVLAALHLKGRD
jgi:ATP phosphoribosyltransferase regulatory subunit